MGIMGIMKLCVQGHVEEIVEVVVVVQGEDAKMEGPSIGGSQMEVGEGEMDGAAHLGHLQQDMPQVTELSTFPLKSIVIMI